jgi:hypothetical protein
MHFGTIVVTLGISMSVIGLFVEAIAIMGVTSYRVRRVLPVSPIPLQALGCCCFCAGVVCVALGKWLFW